MKPTREKRTTTQPGLGKVNGGERRSTLGAGVGSETDIEAVPISAPPPSDRGLIPNVTRALEKAVVSDVPPSTPPEKPVSTERGRAQGVSDPRADGEPSPSGRLERVEGRTSRNSNARVPIDVTHVRQADSRRAPARRVSSKPPAAKPVSKPPRELDRRGSVGSFSAVEAATGRRPIAGTAGAPVAVAVAAATPTGPARSKRVSIREDNLGKNIMDVADAVGATSRIVPKLLKTKAEIAAAPIDHRAGFLLAHVDGVTTVAGLVDVCGMPEEEVAQILERLRRLGIVAVR